MSIAWLVAALALQDPAAPDATVELPPAAAVEPAAPEGGRTFRAESPRTESRRFIERPESGPSLGGFLFWTFVVIGLLGGSFMLLKRFARGSRFMGGGGAIQVLARKPLGQRQEIFLVEVGTKVFMVGSTRDHLTTLGEFNQPDEVAVLRANLPARRDEAMPVAFRESLREGLKEAEAPGAPADSERVYASIAGELAEIRKTVRAWKA